MAHIGRVFTLDALATFGNRWPAFFKLVKTASPSTNYSRPSRETQNQESKSVHPNLVLTLLFCSLVVWVVLALLNWLSLWEQGHVKSIFPIPYDADDQEGT